jgi:DNA-binding CsgD family transcriptional regulator/tetratricopeptide (TPR) repeat protein
VSLSAAIEGRLGYLSAATLESLRAAALLGPRFSVRDLRIVDGRSARELAVAIGEAVAAGVLTESGMDLVFRHGLIQQALAEGLPAGMRAELHRDAAQALAAAGAAAERVAAQLLAAGAELDEWTTGWLAANAHVLVYRAPRPAADLLALAVQQTPATDPRRETLMEYLAGVLMALARPEQAEPLGRELLAGARDPKRQARMAFTLAKALIQSRRRPEALMVIDQALLTASSADAWTARLRAMHAQTLVLESHDEEGGIEAAQALADAERVGDGFAAGSALHVQSMLCFRAGDQAEGLERTERALTLIGDDPQGADLRLLLLNNRMAALYHLGADAFTPAYELLGLAERAGTARLAMVRSAVGQMLYETGKWDDALAELDAVLAPDADVEAAVLAVALGVEAMIAVHRDDQDRLRTLLHTADQMPGLFGLERMLGVLLLRARASAAERDGRPGDAAAMLAATFDGGYPTMTIGLEPDLVRCTLAAGDRPAAQAVAARCERHAAQLNDVLTASALSWRCRGLADGDPVPLERAVAHFRGANEPLGLGEALEDLAVVRAAADGLTAARAALGEAVGIYAELGAEWDLMRADSRLRPYGVRRRRAGQARPQSGWTALTPTETKVAYLVGQGLSNPEIGTRLFLSRYTVQVHVSRILAKLQVRSRVDVASQVARHRAGGGEPGVRTTALAG